MRFRFFILFILCFCFGIKVSAQQIFTVKGVISKKQSAERVPQVLITNLRSKDIMMSDELGYFSINAAIGDTLLFNKKDFTEQKMAVTGKGDVAAYLQPVVVMAEVVIREQSKKKELSEAMSNYKSLGTYYNGKPPLLSFLISPITGLYELFGKTPQEAKRFAVYSKEELEQEEVRRRYNLSLVKQVTNAPDSTAKQFMLYYTPSFEDLKEWNDYELIKRIKKSYDYYEKNKDRLHLESINAPILTHPDVQKP